MLLHCFLTPSHHLSSKEWRAPLKIKCLLLSCLFPWAQTSTPCHPTPVRATCKRSPNTPATPSPWRERRADWREESTRPAGSPCTSARGSFSSSWTPISLGHRSREASAPMAAVTSSCPTPPPPWGPSPRTNPQNTTSAWSSCHRPDWCTSAAPLQSPRLPSRWSPCPTTRSACRTQRGTRPSRTSTTCPASPISPTAAWRTLLSPWTPWCPRVRPSPHCLWAPWR